MWKNDQFHKMVNLSTSRKHKNDQNTQNENTTNAKTCKNSPSDPPHVIFGLKTGSRGTPWNRKSAQPGGSENAKCRFWPFIWHFGHFRGGSIFDTFLIIFHVFILSLFHDFDFLVFVTFDDFWFLSFLHFFCFTDFWSILLIFCCWHHFLLIIVSVLGAPIMTHFLSSKPALPLSPILVVKFDHILTPQFVINFWWFLVNFCVDVSENDEKLDFPIKNHVFWLIFVFKFSEKVIIFWLFLGSFLGILGGYPSPSISAPLVVKKCLKLYIYI